MKKISFLILSSSLLLFACKNEEKETLASFHSKDLGITVSFDKNFEAYENINSSGMQIPFGLYDKIKDSLTDAYRESLLFYKENFPRKVSMDTLLLSAKTILKLQMEDIVISHEDSLKNKDLTIYTYQAQRGSDTLHRVLKQYLIAKGNALMTINGTALESTFKDYESAFDKIVQSIKFD